MLPDWFIPVFIIAVIDWLIVENVVLIWLLREVRRMRRAIEAMEGRKKDGDGSPLAAGPWKGKPPGGGPKKTPGGRLP